MNWNSHEFDTRENVLFSSPLSNQSTRSVANTIINILAQMKNLNLFVNSYTSSYWDYVSKKVREPRTIIKENNKRKMKRINPATKHEKWIWNQISLSCIKNLLVEYESSELDKNEPQIKSNHFRKTHWLLLWKSNERSLLLCVKIENWLGVWDIDAAKVDFVHCLRSNYKSPRISVLSICRRSHSLSRRLVHGFKIMMTFA